MVDSTQIVEVGREVSNIVYLLSSAVAAITVALMKIISVFGKRRN